MNQSLSHIISQVHRAALTACLCIFLTGCFTPPADLQDFIKYQMAQGHIPGLAAAIVKDNSIVWSQGFGFANIETQRPASAETLFHLASISKTVTGTAIMQLWEKGLVELDGDINAYLPYSIRNPFYPEDPITLRMLLTHTSTFKADAVLENLYSYGADSPIALDTLIREIFLPEGKWYNARRCFKKARPGSAYEYSNLGFALLGLIVERVSGQAFDAYCRSRIFRPLAMQETDWFLANLDETHIAMPYRDRGLLRPWYIAYGHYGYPDYPSGQIRTSVTQLAHFLMAFMNDGAYSGGVLLKTATVTEMLQPQIPDIADYQALAWRHFTVGDSDVIGHGGTEQGTCTLAFFTQDKRYGVIVLCNGDPCGGYIRLARLQKAFMAICERLLKHAETL